MPAVPANHAGHSDRSALVVGQSGGATAVINASLAGVVEGALRSGRYTHILGMRNGIEGLLAGRFIDLGACDARTLDVLRRTPSAALGTGRYKLAEGDVDRALDVMAAHGITSFAYIGGNDSADTAMQLVQRAAGRGDDISIASVPKTIDNDLPAMDHCPGYGSIARYIANAVRDATYDTLASPQLYAVKFVEVMGRDAGWVAASGSLGFGASEAGLQPLILLPERAPQSGDAVVSAVAADLERRGWSVVVIPEALRTSSGKHLGGDQPDFIDSFGHEYFASTGEAMTRLVTTRLGVRARYDRPGTAARMSISLVSDVDLDEAYRLGEVAAQHLAAGETGFIPVLHRRPGKAYGCDIETIPISEVANRVRLLPDEFIQADGRGMTSAFHAYARPLMGSTPAPEYVRLH